MAERVADKGALRERCIREALKVIEIEGVEELSLRAVARRLGVSHQAPYKHFASRDHLLAEVVRRTFDAFARYLDQRPQTTSADADLEAMGHAYLTYAATHPLQYRLMFGTPLPDPREHPAMMASARHAFGLLEAGLGAMYAEAGRVVSAETIMQDALFVWSTLHGVASVRAAPALKALALPPSVLERTIEHTLARLSSALLAPSDGSRSG